MKWIIPGKSLSDVKTQVDAALSANPSTSATFKWAGDTLQVLIEKGGKSEFHLGFTESAGNVTVQEVKRKVALLHKPFAGKVEDKVTELLQGLGGSKS